MQKKEKRATLCQGHCAMLTKGEIITLLLACGPDPLWNNDFVAASFHQVSGKLVQQFSFSIQRMRSESTLRSRVDPEMNKSGGIIWDYLNSRNIIFDVCVCHRKAAIHILLSLPGTYSKVFLSHRLNCCSLNGQSTKCEYDLMSKVDESLVSVEFKRKKLLLAIWQLVSMFPTN